MGFKWCYGNCGFVLFVFTRTVVFRRFIQAVYEDWIGSKVGQFDGNGVFVGKVFVDWFGTEPV